MDEAAEFATLAVEYSSRAGDHDRVWSALAILIEHELRRGNGPRAIDYLETCVAGAPMRQVYPLHGRGAQETTCPFRGKPSWRL